MPSRFPQLHLPDDYREKLTDAQKNTYDMLISGTWEPYGLQIGLCGYYLFIVEHRGNKGTFACIQSDGRWTTNLQTVEQYIDYDA